MKKLILIILLIGWPLITTAQVSEPSMDVCLKITGTLSQARSALIALGLDKEMLHRNKAGDLEIVTGNPHVAIDFWRRPILKFGTYDSQGNEVTPPIISDRPILRIRFISKQAREKARLKIINASGLPIGLTKVTCPTTRVWS